VKAFRSCPSADARGIVTQVILDVSTNLKAPGKSPASEGDVTLTVPGGEIGDMGVRIGTSPQFSVGERVVVFLKDAQDGSLQLTEGFQSKYVVSPTGTVGSLGLSLAAFETRVRRAADGALPEGEDPVGGTQIRGDEFGTFARWAISDHPVPYYVNPTQNRPSHLTAQDTRLATILMYHQWQNISSATIAFRYAGDTPRWPSSHCDGINDIHWTTTGALGGRLTPMAWTSTCRR
jgi:hypothetical protein